MKIIPACSEMALFFFVAFMGVECGIYRIFSTPSLSQECSRMKSRAFDGLISLYYYCLLVI